MLGVDVVLKDGKYEEATAPAESTAPAPEDAAGAKGEVAPITAEAKGEEGRPPAPKKESPEWEEHRRTMARLAMKNQRLKREKLALEAAATNRNTAVVPDPVGPVDPVTPVIPVGPVGPVEPVIPVLPVGPVGPLTTWTPSW